MINRSKVNAKTLCDILRHNLTDFERFQAAIHRYLETPNRSNNP